MGREPVIVVDTHVLIWAVQDDPRLGPKARQIIDHTTKHSRILVSAITPWEIAMLAEKGRIALGTMSAAGSTVLWPCPVYNSPLWTRPSPWVASVFLEICTPIPPIE